MPLRVLSLYGFLILFLSACHNTTDSPLSSDLEELPFETIALVSLADFQATEATNWRTVGSVYADRQVKAHLQSTEGEGVLANLPDEQNQANLFTNWEHGDIDLSLDFMMAKGSNSGIYLQGRYEVQLLDSWGIDSVGSSDCGGIYERWRAADRQGYEGHAPRLNASRAPGLWQHLAIKFRAPRFDEQGKKIANALFIEVKLNGVVVQENVAVTGPTRSAAFEDEKPTGPLMIQGDHGPVAIQNVHFKTYASDLVTLPDLSYRRYNGDFRSPDVLEGVAPDKEEAVDSISHEYGLDNDFYAIAFEGTLRVPTDGEYLFSLRSAGPSWLYINGKPATNNSNANYMDRAVGRYRTFLQAGTYPLRLVHTKYELKWVRGISLYVEGPHIRRQPLHAQKALHFPTDKSPMVIKVDSVPVMQRAFINHQQEKKTHAAFVGLPDKMNYTVNLQNGSLLSAWDGDFIDASDMWHQRGEPQTARPLGSPIELSDRPAFAILDDEDAPWPDSIGFEDEGWQAKGYSLAKTGIPLFRYQVGGATIEDHLLRGATERALTRNIRCSYAASTSAPVYCLIAEGSQIEQLPDGGYGVDDKRYYLTVDQAQSAKVMQRTVGGKAQLLAKMLPGQQDVSLRYSIIW